MKKLVALLMALLLCTGAACAQEFTFRNGLHWGMTSDEVLAAEGRASYDDIGSFGSITTAYLLTDISISKFNAAGAYLFVDDQLAGVLIDPYMMVDNNEDDIEYLLNALTTVYGAPANIPVPPTVQAVFDLAGYEPLYVWQPAADSYIGIFVGGPYYGLGYFSTEVDFFNAAPGGNAVNTNGL